MGFSLASMKDLVYRHLMQTASLVLISILGGVVLVVLVAALATVIVLHFRALKSNKELQAALTDYAADFEKMIEGARSSFGGLRADIKASQDAQKKALDATLKKHEDAFRETMGRINATALEAASVRGLKAAQEMTQVAAMLKNMLLAHDVPQPGEDLGPEEYGPSETIYSRQGDTAKMDDIVAAAEAEDAAPLFAEVGAE